MIHPTSNNAGFEDDDCSEDEEVADTEGSRVEQGKKKIKKLPYHCHCPLYEPPDELVASIQGGLAARK